MAYYWNDGGWLTENDKFSVKKQERTGQKDLYEVYLPHQCDDWGITSREDKSAAIADMLAFIQDAQEALKKLTELP